MSVRSRVAFASGAAGAVGAALLISGRYEGSVVLAVLLVFSIRTAALAALVGAGPILASGAVRALRTRAWLAPVWALAIAAAVIRSGSSALVDVRGANAVAGLALAHGPVLTVAGAWLAFGATACALAMWSPLGAETAGGTRATGRIVVPDSVNRLDGAGVLAEAGLAVTLFLGPQVVAGADAVWWATGVAGLVGGAWLARRVTLPVQARRPAVPAAMAALGLALVLAGGPP